MADERTMSRVTRLNSALRNRQDVQTIVDQIQIATWRNNRPEVFILRIVSLQGEYANVQRPQAPAPPPDRPVVKFRDLGQLFKRNPLVAGSNSSAGLSTSATGDGPGTEDPEMDEGDDNDDSWLNGSGEVDIQGVDKTRLIAQDDVDLQSHKLRDVLSSFAVMPPQTVVAEVDSILPAARPKTIPFTFSLK